MAQSIPPLPPAHPIPPNPPMNNANPPQFTPRKEFIRDQGQIISSFSLVALSGTGLVRLYSFPPVVISSLRRVFDQNRLIASVREHAPKNFFEFSLTGKPWANHKSLDSERLIVSIFNTLMQHGFNFVSTIDYGREPDDRLAMTFARPVSIPNLPSNVSPPNGSSLTLLQPVRVVFAVSFLSPTLLRVISPPLSSTPAILQAVKGAWPRGLVDEKKVGDVFQFQFKGYKWYEEDTFAVDSLHQIFELLARLNKEEFSLITSLSFNNKSRSRTKDIWIFAGPSGEASILDTPHPSPAGAGLELRRDLTVQIPYAAHLSNEKLSPVGSHRPVNGSTSNFPETHLRTNIDTTPLMSSPLKPADATQTKGQSVLRKSPPKMQMPLAFSSDPFFPGQGPYMARQYNDQLTDSVGSLDMTGIGSGRGRADSQPRTPDVFYSTGGQGRTPRYDAINPYDNLGKISPPTPGAVSTSQALGGRENPAGPRTRVSSLNAGGRDNPAGPRPRVSSLNTGGRDSPAGPRPRVPSQNMMISTSPPHKGDTPENVSSPSSSANSSGIRERKVSSPIPANLASTSGPTVNGSIPPDETERSRRELQESVRSVTPPLLPSGIFRDSAFSSTTGWRSTEIPIQWTGKEPEVQGEVRRFPLPGVDEVSERSEKSVVDEPRWTNERGPKIFQTKRAQGSGPLRTFGAGPGMPGISTPKDERNLDDVAMNMLPPTIQERPSQEADANDFAHVQGLERLAGPEVQQREGTSMARPTPTPQMPTNIQATRKSAKALPGNYPRTLPAQSPAPHRPTQRQERPPSGWVMVNIEGRQPGTQSKNRADSPSRPRATTRGSSMSPVRTPHSRPMVHQRSNSDPRAHRRLSADRAEMAAISSMSPAAKAIAIIDAVGAKEQEKEKASSGSAFMRIFSRSRDKVTQASHSVTPPQNRSRIQPLQGESKMRTAEAEVNYETDGSGRWGHGPPPIATRAHNKRYSVN